MKNTYEVIKRSLNLGSKELQAFIENGYEPATFVGENLSPFHAFVKSDVCHSSQVSRFMCFGEVIEAKRFGTKIEGWFTKVNIHIFEIVDKPQPQTQYEPQLAYCQLGA